MTKTRKEITSKAGRVRSEAKTQAARENGKQGGRPADPRIKAIMSERGVSRQRAHQILRSRPAKLFDELALGWSVPRYAGQAGANRWPV